MKFWQATPIILVAAVFFFIGLALVTHGQGNGDPGEQTPAPASPNLPIDTGGGLTPMQAQSVTVNGVVVTLPEGATVSYGYTESGASGSVRVDYGNSRVTWIDGTVDKYIEPQDEAALSELLEELE